MKTELRPLLDYGLSESLGLMNLGFNQNDLSQLQMHKRMS